MAKLVPYLADEMTESDAALLLAEYAHARGIGWFGLGSRGLFIWQSQPEWWL